MILKGMSRLFHVTLLTGSQQHPQKAFLINYELDIHAFQLRKTNYFKLRISTAGMQSMNFLK